MELKSPTLCCGCWQLSHEKGGSSLFILRIGGLGDFLEGSRGGGMERSFFGGCFILFNYLGFLLWGIDLFLMFVFPFDLLYYSKNTYTNFFSHPSCTCFSFTVVLISSFEISENKNIWSQ